MPQSELAPSLGLASEVHLLSGGSNNPVQRYARLDRCRTPRRRYKRNSSVGPETSRLVHALFECMRCDAATSSHEGSPNVVERSPGLQPARGVDPTSGWSRADSDVEGCCFARTTIHSSRCPTEGVPSRPQRILEGLLSKTERVTPDTQGDRCLRTGPSATAIRRRRAR